MKFIVVQEGPITVLKNYELMGNYGPDYLGHIAVMDDVWPKITTKLSFMIENGRRFAMLATKLTQEAIQELEKGMSR